MIVREARQCKFRVEDDEGDGSCPLSGCDCPARGWVKRAEPLLPHYGPRTIQAEILDMITTIRLSPVPGPEPKYSPEDQARLDDYYKRQWPEFCKHHKQVEAIPQECRLREGGMIFGDEPVTLDVVDPRFVSPPDEPDVAPINQTEMDAAWGCTMSGFMAHFDAGGTL